jgi:hypothetical protein
VDGEARFPFSPLSLGPASRRAATVAIGAWPHFVVGGARVGAITRWLFRPAVVKLGKPFDRSPDACFRSPSPRDRRENRAAESRPVLPSVRLRHRQSRQTRALSDARLRGELGRATRPGLAASHDSRTCGLNLGSHRLSSPEASSRAPARDSLQLDPPRGRKRGRLQAISRGDPGDLLQGGRMWRPRCEGGLESWELVPCGRDEAPVELEQQKAVGG